MSRHGAGIWPRVTFVRASWPSDVSLQISKLSFLSRASKAVGCRCTFYVPPARPCVGLRSSFCSIINVNSAINSTNQSVLIMVTDGLYYCEVPTATSVLPEMVPWLRWLVRRRGGTGSIPSQGLWCTKCNCDRFLGAFAKLGKAIISFVMSVRLSVRHVCPCLSARHVCPSVCPHGTTRLLHWTDFHEI